MRIGIVGLPNVGKSTLFNALTKQAALARNVPFTTIEPNVGVVPVPDERLDVLSKISSSAKIVPTTIEFVDIAGLVRDAHKGEGLGNKFLANIREVDAIIHVVRFFEASDIIHVDNKVDPISDAETINTELALADLTSVEKALERNEKLAKGNDKEAVAKVAIYKRLQAQLAQGNPARDLTFEEKEQPYVRELFLLTIKPILYIANVDEAQIGSAEEVTKVFTNIHKNVLPISIKIEQELVELSDEERLTFLQEYGLSATGLDRLINASYKLLHLITFFTSGEKETRAWTVRAGSTAPQAAGEIHSDFERGFIRAETVAYDDLTTAGSYAAARAVGKVRDEGKGYIVKDGDIMLFKFSV
ncbi:MAG: redox-regulated ATPase YchF [Candidatus Andersenbacteria bacterium]